MANTLAPVFKQQFFDNNGRPAAGYKLFSYEGGTSTKLDTYPSSIVGVPNPNPISLNFRGEADVWIPPNVAYKFVFASPTDTDPPTNPIWTVDLISNLQLITLYGGVDIGIANAYVLNFVANFTSYTDGIVIYWTPSHTNTGPSTVNVNGLGPVALTLPDGSALPPGIIQANGVVQMLFKGTGFQLMFSSQLLPQLGSFTMTATGFTTTVTGTAFFARNGNIVTLIIPTLTGTSNANTLTLTGIPAAIVPATSTSSQNCTILCADNGINEVCRLIMLAGSTTWTISRISGAGFTASGTKGPANPFVVTYISPNP